MTTYERRIEELILNYSELKIQQVRDIKIVKTLPSYHKHLNKIENILKTGNYEELENIHDDSKSFDDLTIVNFKSESNQEYYGIIYDDWELWTNPTLTIVYPHMV